MGAMKGMEKDESRKQWLKEERDGETRRGIMWRGKVANDRHPKYFMLVARHQNGHPRLAY